MTIDETLTAALADVVHVGDYGVLWINEERQEVHLTMGDSDGDPQPDSPYTASLTTFDVIRRKTTEALRVFWPGWSAGESAMGDLDGGMMIADEWDPNEDEGWREVGFIGRTD